RPGERDTRGTAATAAGHLDPSNTQAPATPQVAAAAPPPKPPQPPVRRASRSSWCSPSGDVCYGRLRGRGPIRLGLTLAARYFKHYRLCLTGPEASTTCRRFAVHRRHGGTWGSIVRWHRRFPDLGSGTYQAGWSS